MQIQFKKVHPAAKLPTQGRHGDAAFDLYCVEDVTLFPGETKAIGTGLQLAQMPSKTHEGDSVFLHIVGRGGLASKGIFPIGGIVDVTYRGEIKVVMHNGNIAALINAMAGSLANPNEPIEDTAFHFKVGDRIAQVLIQKIVTNDSYQPLVMMSFTEEVEETSRGAGGFGSSGT